MLPNTNFEEASFKFGFSPRSNSFSVHNRNIAEHLQAQQNQFLHQRKPSPLIGLQGSTMPTATGGFVNSIENPRALANQPGSIILPECTGSGIFPQQTSARVFKNKL